MDLPTSISPSPDIGDLWLSDFTGPKGFTALTSLTIHTSMYVPGISNIDLSTNPNLISFILGDGQSITNLDLTKNIALQSLILYS